MANSQTKSVLDDIMAHKAKEVALLKQKRPLSSFEHQVVPIESGRLEAAFQNKKAAVHCILEIKPASPSAGLLTEIVNLSTLLPLYQQYGVGISVLTDEKYFGGSLKLLTSVKNNVSVPVLRKDFILDPYQVYEARDAGADAVLLIVKALSDVQLAELTELIRKLGMTPLIEIQNEAELSRAMAVQPTILLINNRDLQSLEIDLATTERLAPLIPSGILRVSASGIENRQDIERLKPYCDGFLIGSLLMRQPSAERLEQTLQELTQ